MQTYFIWNNIVEIFFKYYPLVYFWKTFEGWRSDFCNVCFLYILYKYKNDNN